MSPVYDILCLSCGAVQRDVLLSVKVDVSKGECPGCGKKTLKKLPCRVHARFFGSGWTKPHTKGD